MDAPSVNQVSEERARRRLWWYDFGRASGLRSVGDAREKGAVVNVRSINIVLVLSLSGLGAAAESKERSVKDGVRAYALGKYEAAVEILLGVVTASGKDAKEIALARRYLAASHHALGKADAARAVIVALLKAEPTAALDPKRFPPDLVQTFADIKKTVRGKLDVVCERDDAVIEVIGVSAGRCGQTLELPVGEYRVRAVVDGEPTRAHDVVIYSEMVRRLELALPKKVGFLTLRVSPATAVVVIDNQEVRGGSSLERYRMAPGPHVVTIRAENHIDETRTVEIKPGKEEMLAVALKPVPKAVDTSTTLTKEPTPPPPPSRAKKTVGWILAGTGLATIVGGVVTQIWVHNEKQRGEAQANTGSYSLDDISSLQGTERIANGFIIAGGVVAAAGVVLLVLDALGRPALPRGGSGVRLSLGPVGAHAGARGVGVAAAMEF